MFDALRALSSPTSGDDEVQNSKFAQVAPARLRVLSMFDEVESVLLCLLVDFALIQRLNDPVPH